MHYVEINILDLKSLHRFLEFLHHAAPSIDPKLRRNKQVFPLHDAFLDALLNSLSDSVFILVHFSGIDMSVAVVSDGLLGHFVDFVLWVEPGAETEHWLLDSAQELLHGDLPLLERFLL